jgi:hypothetical protein
MSDRVLHWLGASVFMFGAFLCLAEAGARHAVWTIAGAVGAFVAGAMAHQAERGES